MTKSRGAARAFQVLLAWHGLFAGAYTIAYLTAERSAALHEFAGYATMALLAVRLLMAAFAPEGNPWALPWASAALWRNFVRKLRAGDPSALRGRTPFVPLSGLLILGLVVLAAVSGLAAEWWRLEDLHEGLAEGSLVIVVIHLALVLLPQLLKHLGRPVAQTPEPLAVRGNG